jgi:hypothetical protein
MSKDWVQSTEWILFLFFKCYVAYKLFKILSNLKRLIEIHQKGYVENKTMSANNAKKLTECKLNVARIKCRTQLTMFMGTFILCKR